MRMKTATGTKKSQGKTKKFKRSLSTRENKKSVTEKTVTETSVDLYSNNVIGKVSRKDTNSKGMFLAFNDKESKSRGLQKKGYIPDNSTSISIDTQGNIPCIAQTVIMRTENNEPIRNRNRLPISKSLASSYQNTCLVQKGKPSAPIAFDCGDYSEYYQVSNTDNPKFKIHLSPHRIAPSTPGYFVRQDYSNDGSSRTQNTCIPQHDSMIQEIPLCNFGCIKYPNSKFKDMSVGNNVPVDGNGVSNIHFTSFSPSPGNRKKSKQRRSNITASAKKGIKKQNLNSKKATGSKIRSPSTESCKDLKREPNQSFKPKTGITIRQIHKKVNKDQQPRRYTKKILDSKSKKFFKKMGSLPVSSDSILYYYEPRGDLDSYCRLGSMRVRNLKGESKGKGKTILMRANSQDLEHMKTVYKPRKHDSLSNLNTNGNANSSDTDLSDPKNAKRIENDHFIAETTRAEHMGIVPVEKFSDTSQSGDQLGNDLQVHSLEGDVSAVKKKLEEDSIPCSLDMMVDDFIQNAFKDETEYDRIFIQDSPNKGKDVAKLQIENNTEITDDEISKCPERHTMKNILKSTNISHENQKSTHLKKKSSSSPNFKKHEVKTNETSHSQRIASLSSPDLQNKLQLQCPENSVSVKSDTPTERKATVSSETNVFPRTTPEVVSKETAVHAKERGRSKKSKENPSTVSILRKVSHVPQEEKRTQSYPHKHPGLRKTTLALEKASRSLSPTPKRTQGGFVNAKINKDCHEMDPHKTIPHKGEKKGKKRVRIAVDCSSLQSDKTGKDQESNQCSKLKEDGASQTDEISITQDSGVYLAELIEKSKVNSPGEEEEEGKEEVEDLIEQDEVAPVCGFQDATSEQSDQESTPCVSPTLTSPKLNLKKQTTKKSKKVKKPKEVDKVREMGWDNSSISKADMKSKEATTKRKRYQIKKTKDNQVDKGKVEKFDAMGMPSSPSIVNDEGTNSCKDRDTRPASDVDTGLKKGQVQSTSTKFPKSILNKKPSYSPRSRRRMCDKPILGDCNEGSSVDAPSFNTKKEIGVKTTRSGPLANTGKPKDCQSVRCKPAKDTFGRTYKRGNISPGFPSPRLERSVAITNQVSPTVSRSTDLDIAFKRNQSPGRSVTGGRLTRPEYKTAGSRARSKSESEDCKEDALETRPPSRSQRRRIDPITDPMDMNVLNIGLSWMVQGLISRLSFLNPKLENDKPSPSPMVSTTPVATDPQSSNSHK